MNTTDYHHIDIEPFDREYHLADLLPRKTLEAFFNNCSALLADPLAVCHVDGTVYARQGDWDHRLIDSLPVFIAQNQPSTERIASSEENTTLWVFPVEVEMEAVGYLALAGENGNDSDVLSKGRAVASLLHQLMRLTYQTLLTSGLHGMVVESSYADLREKARQLTRSEEKYRRLAANLEIEVQKKTEEIRNAHVHLIQQEKLAAIGQLSAGMAHEINNPLGFILSNLKAFESYAGDFSALVAVYRKLISSYRRMGDKATDESVLHAQIRAVADLEKELDIDFILDDLLTATRESMDGAQRIQKIVADLKTVARPGVTKPEAINLQKSINAVLSILDHRLGAGIRIERKFTPVPSIRGFAQELNQVWFNLLMNALDAVGEQGTITIATKPADRQVVVSITDTGGGIAEKHRSKIFDPFFTTKEIGQGTGLGLHLAHRLVDQHGGRISVQSDAGQGATFTVILPVTGG